MGDFDLTATTSATDVNNDYDYDYELSDNVVEDLIEYSRANIVKNEEQFLLGTFGYISGFFEDPSHFISWVMIGTAGCGKSHTANVIEALFPDSYLYKSTSGSAKSIIYDSGWEHAYAASLDELQKQDDEIIEVLKSVHGGEDGGFQYKVTGDGQGADRDVDSITRSPMPYSFLYAQYDPDFELWDRLLKIPIHESKEKNEGVVATQWDHQMIGFGGSEHEYMFEFPDGEKALKERIEELPKDVRVKIPAGEDKFGWDAAKHVKPIFDINRSETNRVAGMVANLVRASALLNYDNREKTSISDDGEVKEAFIAAPQDVANILACRDVLLATTHQLDRKKKALCLAIQEQGGAKNAASISDIIEHLRQTNASFVKRSQVEHMLQDLIDNHLVEKLERAGENGAHLYKFNGFHQLGQLNINDNFEDVFGDCHDPITDKPFVESMREQNKELRPSMADFMTDESVSTDSESAGQQSLTTDSVSRDLTALQEAIQTHLYETLDGEIVTGLDEHEPSIKEMLGIVDVGEDEDAVDLSDTIYDPDHEVWLHEAGVDEESNTQQTEERITDEMGELQDMGVWDTEVVKARGSTPIEMKIHVEEP